MIVNDDVTKKIIKEMKGYALSDQDIKNALNINIITYPYLNNVKHIDEIFDKKGRSIILYLFSQNEGHYVAVLKHVNNKDTVIEWFDSYGNAPKDIYKGLNIPTEVVDNLNEWPDVFLNLVNQSGYSLVWNKQKNQQYKTDINTCGDWATMRCLFYFLSLDDFNYMVNSISKKYKITKDDLVSSFVHTNLLK